MACNRIVLSAKFPLLFVQEMKSFVFHFALLSVLLGAHGRSVPDNVRQFYDSVKSTECVGTHKLKGGFHDTDDGPKGTSVLIPNLALPVFFSVALSTDISREWSYCQSGDGDDSVIYLQGPSTLTNMDIDCDGTGGRRGRCGSSTDTQSETAFKDQVRKYGIKDLNADIHPYVVFGNEGDYSPTFNPQDHGMKPLSVMAVVCGNKLVR